MTRSNSLRTALRSSGLAGSLFVLSAAFASAQQVPAAAGSAAADIIFVHGDILTGTHLKPGEPDPIPARVQALAVRAGKIVAAGDDKQALAWKGPDTVIEDLGGAFVMPGFNDAHTHMAEAGRQRLTADLVGTRSLAEMQDRLKAYVATLGSGQWVLGGGWDHTLWPGKTLPNRGDLDAVTGNHPALLIRVDGHIGVANTAALRAAGLTAATPDPAGGQIDHGPDGQPTGIVREAPALALLQDHIPKPDWELRKRALRMSIDDALAHGVTSVQDFSDWEDWLVLEGWEREHKLPLRFAEWIAFDTSLAVLEQRRASHPADDPLLHLTQLKAFMDGSLGSRTAALHAPYSDEADTEGLPRYEQDRLNDMAASRAQAGFQLGFHAIGDRANDMALDAFEAAEQVGVPAPDGQSLCPETQVPNGPSCRLRNDFRFRIEHAQVVSPGAYARFASLGVIASMQPSHLLTDMAWAGQRLGPERSKRAYAWRSFLDHGVVLAFGTDYPVESISPFRGLYSAITRQNEAGTQSFEPQEKISLNEAIFAYTQGAAFAEFREKEKGRLEPGYLADFIVLDRDITKTEPKKLLETHVLRTVIGGRTRFDAQSANGAKSAALNRVFP